MNTRKERFPINNKRADNRSSWLMGYRLCVYVLDAVITNAVLR